MHPKNNLVSLLVVLAISAAVGCADPAADKPAAVVKDATGVPSPAKARADAYVISDGSTVGFVGSKVTGRHDGGFRDFEGKIHLVDGQPELSSVEVEIDTTSLWTDAERLTGHLKSPDFFDVEKYPTASFRSVQIVPEGESYTITGDLELHGVTKSISFPATITVEPGRVQSKAEFSIKRFDFGIVYPGKADDLIRDDVVIKLDLVAIPEGDEESETEG